MQIKILGLSIFTLISVVFIQCSKSGELINEPSYGIIKFTTFTIDTFRFKVKLNDQLITDSLLSPRGVYTATVPFIDTIGKLKITDAKNNLILDSTINLKIGSRTISLVQFISGLKPTTPTLSLEAQPVNGFYKIRFQYAQPIGNVRPFYDSIKIQIRREDNNNFIDTIVLKKYGISRYYELPKTARVKVKLINPNGGTFPTTSAFSNAIADADIENFNTAILFYRSGSGYTLERAY
jgi:hypothetical protein